VCVDPMLLIAIALIVLWATSFAVTSCVEGDSVDPAIACVMNDALESRGET